MKRYYLLMLLVCLFGSNALAQEHAMTTVTETIDFSVVKHNGNPNVNFEFDNNHPMINDEVVSTRVTVENTNDWGFWGSDTYNESYLQKRPNTGTSYVYLSDLKAGDVVTIWGECGNQDDGSFDINGSVELLNTTYYDYNNKTYPNSKEYRITNPDGVQIQFVGNYSGIRKITIQSTVRAESYYNYDPGYESYDFFEVRDEILDRDNDGNITAGPTDNTSHTDYSVSDAGFNLNGNSAQYFTFDDNDLTLNNRIAISQSGRWRFARGLIVPDGENDAYFSICNLKKGDRIQIFYTGDNPVFASQADGTYNGCPAFYDTWNDGNFDPDDDGDHYIAPGDQVEYIASLDRDEGTLSRDEQNRPTTLHSSAIYVITEDGHMDFRLNNTDPLTRIIKVYIWSDHQATMIDDYSERDYQYTSRFDITGELQAKEHIVPGGLEVRVGNEDKSQHAIVVSSKGGAVSYVNAVDGFKLPGVTKNEDTDKIEINFNLGGNDQNDIPTSGTFYKFMPLESGTMKVKFTAYSMYYYRYDIKGNDIYFDEGGTDSNGRNHTAWRKEFGRGNEQTVNRRCPYYVKVSADNGNTFTNAPGVRWTGGSSELMNGAEGEFVLNVEAGKIYYLFGGWTSGANGDNTNLNNFDFMFIRNINNHNVTPHGCGVAELFDVAFTPAKQIYPLAKWVPSGTAEDDDLATIVGYQETELTVKKMSGNITGCHPYIYETTDDKGKRIHKLGIKDVSFADGENPGGVVLIKFGTRAGGRINYYKVDPVYVFTVAYDANYHSTSNYAEELRGHTWDFSSSSLRGLEWEPTQQNVPKLQNVDGKQIFVNNANQNFATAEPFGTYFNNFFANGETAPVTTSFLYEEMNYVDNGVNRSDWMFNYRLQKNGLNYDPRFLNKYDMEGDNADMIWDTEGIIIEANSNMSCIFNEFGDGNTHSSSTDPDRYVGILSGGSFLIPHLNKDDRVIIYMGSGTDSEELLPEEMKFRITNARDALYKEILEDDVYLAGGSQWNSANSDNNYRGCYHFFAKADGDMKFTLEGSNSICKLYKIQIYRGDRINTNDVVGETSDDKFLLWSRAADPNDEDDVAAMGDTYNWTLKYFGKAQKLADGTNGVNNDFAAKTGCINYELATSAETDPTKATYNTFSYPNDYGQIGTFRARGKDMEKNMKYVADYGEHNVTIAYQETMEYPYTWDFMDMTGWGNNVQNFVYEDGIGSLMTSRPAWYDSDDLWNASYEKSSSDLSLWEVNSQDNTYYLRLNSQSGQTSGNLKEVDNIFETAKDIDGNQVWANGAIVPETQGLWFYTLNNNSNNGTWGVTNDGLAFNGLSTMIQKVVVPNVPAGAAVYLRMVTDRDVYAHEFEFKGGNSGYKVYGPELVTGTTDEYILAVRNDGAKRHLTFSLAGYQLKKLSVSTDPKSVNIKGYSSESRDHAIDASLLPYFTGKDMKTLTVSEPDYTKRTLTLTDVGAEANYVIPTSTGCIIYDATDKGEFNPFNDGNGFHLFVPDMHDQTGKDMTVANMLTPQLTETKLGSYDGAYVNYVLSYKYYQLNGDDPVGDQLEGEEMFYRVSSKGIKLRDNSAYLKLLKENVHPSGGTTTPAKFTFRFSWEDDPVPTTIEEANVMDMLDGANSVWYNLNGQKLNGKPESKGLYIVNGKKVLVK